MSALWVAVGVLALGLIGGLRRGRWDAVGPVIWWREQRLRRRPTRIIGRLVKVALAAFLLVASVVVVLLGVGLVMAFASAAVVLVAVWWWLRAAARASTPRLELYERDDVDLSPPGDPVIEGVAPPRAALLPPLPPEDPDYPRALEL